MSKSQKPGMPHTRMLAINVLGAVLGAQLNQCSAMACGQACAAAVQSQRAYQSNEYPRHACACAAHFIVMGLPAGVNMMFWVLNMSRNPPTADALAIMETMAAAVVSRRPAKAENATMLLV